MKRLAFVLFLFMLCISSNNVTAYNITSRSSDDDPTTILIEGDKDKTAKPNSSGRRITVKYRYDSYSKSVFP